jgi:hypothetical protein
MKRTHGPSVTKTLLVGAALIGAGCGEPANDTGSITVTIESQDNIVSENGVLELTSGTLRVQSVSLIGDGDTVPLVGPATLDLSLSAQELVLPGRLPPGSYSGLRIELAPAAGETRTIDLELRATATGEAVRAISDLSMSGDTSFPEGPRLVTESSRVELHLLLRGMLFYLAPLTDAVDGVFLADESHRDFLTMDLIGMFDLRVSAPIVATRRAAAGEGSLR